MQTKLILETENLTLSEAKISDAPFIFNLLNSPNWLEFIGDRNIRNLQDAEKYIQDSLLKSYQENGFGLWKIQLKLAQTPVGLCGFLNRETFDFPDLGFAILPEYEGFGYVSEVAKAAISYAKSDLSLGKILAITNSTNLGSQRVLEKTGFGRNGEIKMDDELLWLYEIAESQ